MGSILKIQVSRFADYSNSDYRNEVTACLFYGILKIQVFTFADYFYLFLGSSRLSLQKPHSRFKIAQSLSIDRFEETGGMLASLNAQPTERKRSISWTLPATSFFQLRVLCNYLKTAWTLCSGVPLFRSFSAKLQTRTAKTSETFIR